MAERIGIGANGLRMEKGKYKILILLHLLLAGYSLSTVFIKMSGNYDFLTFGFIVCYGLALLCMFLYAIFWQQIIKKLPLTLAFANKAVTLVWGIVYGALFFSEKINIGKLVGAAIVMAGVIMYVLAESEDSGVIETSSVSYALCENEEVDDEQ